MPLTDDCKMIMHPHQRKREEWWRPPAFRPAQEALTVAKPELGTKRICPETGRKFYDLNRDPIVSPFTGKSYPLSYFEDTASSKVAVKEKEEEEEVAEVDSDTDSESDKVEIVSLEEADEETSGGSDDSDIPDMGDDEDDDVEIDDDDDTFLEEDDDDDDDVSGIIGVSDDDDD